MYQVISVGSATLDVYVKSKDFKVVPAEDSPTGVVLCETYGAKLEVDDIHMLSGGGATNTAASFKKKGLSCSLIAEMGRDPASTVILDELHADGIDTSYIVQEQDERTAVSVVLVAGEGGRSIVTSRGASKMLEPKDIPWEKLETEWLYISSLGGRMDTLASLLGHASENSIKVAINPGSSELAQSEELKSLISQVDVLMVNEEEAIQLVGERTSIHEIIKSLAELGAGMTLVTLGGKGAYLSDSNKKLHFCPASPKLPVETTGAGDAFGSGFISGLLLGWEPTQALQLAGCNAEGVIDKIGPKAGLITIEEFEALEKPTITPVE